MRRETAKGKSRKTTSACALSYPILHHPLWRINRLTSLGNYVYFIIQLRRKTSLRKGCSKKGFRIKVVNDHSALEM